MIEKTCKICPIMARGWLSNKYAARGQMSDAWTYEYLPKCLEEKCALWNPALSRLGESYCKLGNKS